MYARTFTFGEEQLPPPPKETAEERAKKELLISAWLKKNSIKKFPYRAPQ